MFFKGLYNYKIIFIYFLVVLNVHAKAFYADGTITQTLIPWLHKSDHLGNSTIEKIDVQDKEEILIKYGHILKKNTKNVIFNIKESRSCMVRASDLLGRQMESLDELFFTNSSGQSFSEAKEPEEDDEATNEWLEFSYNNISTGEYSDYIPISACHSEEFGSGGLIQSSKILAISVAAWNVVTFQASMMAFTLSLAPQLATQEYNTFQGIVGCTIPKGLVGQIFLKPDFVKATPTSRKVRWSRKMQKFLVDPNIQKHSDIQLLLHESSTEIICATNDKITLQCGT